MQVDSNLEIVGQGIVSAAPMPTSEDFSWLEWFREFQFVDIKNVVLEVRSLDKSSDKSPSENVNM